MRGQMHPFNQWKIREPSYPRSEKGHTGFEVKMYGYKDSVCQLKVYTDICRAITYSNYNNIGHQAAEILQNTERQFISIQQELDALRIK
jgi:hypothetical protein